MTPIFDHSLDVSSLPAAAAAASWAGGKVVRLVTKTIFLFFVLFSVSRCGDQRVIFKLVFLRSGRGGSRWIICTYIYLEPESCFLLLPCFNQVTLNVCSGES